jgi:transcriptional regulator with XRE-family HTH domain
LSRNSSGFGRVTDDVFTSNTHRGPQSIGKRPGYGSSTNGNQTSRREGQVVLVRQELGDVLRDFRLQKGRTLRQVASKASVALGYLSEVERGQKEASSEILASVADALETPISVIMREVGDRLAVIEGIDVPDTVPVDLSDRFDDSFAKGFGADLVAR